MCNLAYLHNIKLLKEAKRNQIETYVDQLSCNPLAIKWFVYSIANGSAITDILRNKKTLLEFCLSNVYDKISEIEKDILKCIIAVRKPITASEIAYYSGLEALDAKSALNHLLATSFINMKVEDDENLFSLSSFAHQYLQTRINITKNYIDDITKKRKGLIALSEQNHGMKFQNRYCVSYIEVKHNSEKIILSYLNKVFLITRTRHLTPSQEKTIDDLLETAKAVAPTFYETYRVAAFAETVKTNPNLIFADEEYKKALELSPKNPRVLFFYAGFLLNHFDDLETALRMLDDARKIEPQSVDVAISHARCIGYQGNLTEAIKLLNAIEPQLQKHKRVIASSLIEFYIRMNERLIKVDKNYVDSLLNIHNGMKILDCAREGNYVDSKIIDKAKELWDSYSLIPFMSQEEISQKHYYNITYFTSFSPEKQRSIQQDAKISIASTSIGNVIELHPSFAFIETQNRERYYFNKKNLIEGQDWSQVTNGLLVEFSIFNEANKTYAHNVKLVQSDE
ncbi:MAG: tetratricopeptide repeat protein [Victivallaceae bacterium]